MKNKVYIIVITEGYGVSYREHNQFSTQSKTYAEKWVKQFNRIVENHEERCKSFMQSDSYINSEKEFSTHEYISYQQPVASIEELELRQR